MSGAKPITPDQITIAVTVFSRRQYVLKAVASALNQTVPVRVMVVEDCGPDAGLEAFVKQEFGSRIDYVRNACRRGLFGNWNACMEVCQTEWLSILHDDDYLKPYFVESMLNLSAVAGDCGLFFGQTDVVDEQGKLMPERMPPPLPIEWRRVYLKDALIITPFPFPGQLFRIENARAVGGFRETSLYCGDWEMWSKIIAYYGAAQTAATVAVQLQHRGWDRGTNQVLRAGKLYPLSYVQHKRNLALLRKTGVYIPFNRIEFQKKSPLPIRYLARYGSGFSRRILAYNIRLLLLSEPPHWRYWLVRTGVRLVGSSLLTIPFLVAGLSRRRASSAQRSSDLKWNALP
jgi:glycosyltransferase involved in cell wall biosynthesis